MYIVMIWLLLAFLDTSGDKEYLLLGDYSSAQSEGPADSNSSDEECRVQTNCSNNGDAYDSSSSTDVDVVVQEYRERVQVSV